MDLRSLRGTDAAGSKYRHALLELFTSFLSDLPAIRSDGRVKWDAESVVVTGVLMMLDQSDSLSQSFGRAIEILDRERKGRPVGRTYNGLVDAAMRLRPRELRSIRRRLQAAVRQTAGRDWTIGRWVPFAVDGTNFDCPRTASNVEAFGRNGDAVNGPPQQGVVAMWHMGVGLLWSTRTGASSVPEWDPLMRMLPELPPSALVVMDAGFARYDVLERMDREGVSFLVRAGANVHLLRGLDLETTDDGETVHLWPQARRDRRPLALRRIVVRDKGRKMTLLTNVRRGLLSKRLAVQLYKRRWGIETMYRDLKQTMARRRMRATSAVCARMELEATLLAYAMLGVASVRALRAEGRPAQERSAASGLAAVRWAMRHRPTMQSLRRRLAVPKDTRVRTGSRHDPNWPHKKNDPMPRTARERLATPAERIAAAAWRPN